MTDASISRHDLLLRVAFEAPRKKPRSRMNYSPQPVSVGEDAALPAHGASLYSRGLDSHTHDEPRMSDRELADLGISRFSIPEIAREAAYGK